MQSSPNKTKKSFVKVRLQKVLAMQQPLPNQGPQRRQFVLPPTSWQVVGRGQQCQHCGTQNSQTTKLCIHAVHPLGGQQAHGHESVQSQSTQQPLSSPARSRRQSRSASSTPRRPWYQGPAIYLTRALVVFGLILVVGNLIYGTFSFSPRRATATPQGSASRLAASPTSEMFKWTTTHTFSGNDSQKTDIFTIDNNWRIVWSCNPASVASLNYPVFIEVDAPDGSILDRGVETLCQNNNTQGAEEIYAWGQMRLNVICEGDWAVQVQEWK